LKRPIVVRNVNRTNNSTRAIIHQVEVNMYYKSHIERIRINVYDLGKTDIILEMLWLQAHNPEINWKIKEVKITRCLPLYGRNIKLKEKKKERKKERLAKAKKHERCQKIPGPRKLLQEVH